MGHCWSGKISHANSKLLSVRIYYSLLRNKLRSPNFDYFLFCSDAQGAILVYDVTKQGTFQKLDSWLNELEIYGTKQNLIKMVVGNKIDQTNREVSRDEGIRFAKKHRTLFLETSAKTSEGVKDAFEEVVRKILETTDLWERRSTGFGTIDLNNPDQEPQSYCNGLCSLA